MRSHLQFKLSRPQIFSALSLTMLGLLFSPLGDAAASTFNVLDLGASGNGSTLDTAAIQKAFNDCKASGGTVKFPAGTYLSQPLKIYSHTTILLEPGATLLATTNQRDFMKVPGNWLKAKSGSAFIPFISGKDLTNVTFKGGGVIDGNGHVWWGAAEKAREKKSGYTLPRPNLIVIQRAKNVRLENITLENSPKFHFVPTECTGVVVSNVTVLAPQRAANTDAIDPSDCKNVLITHCKINVGDDDVAIKAGDKVPGRNFACENIVIKDCKILHGHGISIGSETDGGVRNMTVKNCTFANTENGLRIKSRPGRGGIVENITYSNITMSNVNQAITFTCAYANHSAGDKFQPKPQANPVFKNNHKIPTFRHIRVENLTATCPKKAGLIDGLPESCITDVQLDNIKISAKRGVRISNARNIRFHNVQVSVKKEPPFILHNAQVEGLH